MGKCRCGHRQMDHSKIGRFKDGPCWGQVGVDRDFDQTPIMERCDCRVFVPKVRPVPDGPEKGKEIK